MVDYLSSLERFVEERIHSLIMSDWLIACLLSTTALQVLARELEIWAKLRHPNVLPLLGYIVDDDARYPALISEWMSNGTVLQYCIAHPAACIVNLVSGSTRSSL